MPAYRDPFLLVIVAQAVVAALVAQSRGMAARPLLSGFGQEGDEAIVHGPAVDQQSPFHRSRGRISATPQPCRQCKREARYRPDTLHIGHTAR